MALRGINPITEPHDTSTVTFMCVSDASSEKLCYGAALFVIGILGIVYSQVSRNTRMMPFFTVCFIAGNMTLVSEISSHAESCFHNLTSHVFNVD